MIPDLPHRVENDRIWEITGLLMFLFTAGYRILRDGYDPFFWFGICFLIGLAALILKIKQKKN